MSYYFLCDIEGTTSDIEFVHKVLFPYSREHMRDYFVTNIDRPLVREVIEMVTQELESQSSEVSDELIIHTLIDWIDRDVKHPALKTIQAPIWKMGFENGDFQAHVYADVKPCFEQWRSENHQIGIYSSGSEAAQRLFFKHSQVGDLTDFFSHHFDLKMGSKRESESYGRIVENIGRPAEEVVFLSDVPEELEAARSVGMKVVHLCRPGIASSPDFPEVNDFRQIKVEEL